MKYSVSTVKNPVQIVISDFDRMSEISQLHILLGVEKYSLPVGYGSAQAQSRQTRQQHQKVVLSSGRVLSPARV